MKTLLCLVLLNLNNYANSAKILGVYPVVAPSHYILGSALMKELAERGHDVTIITPFAEKSLPENKKYREILLTGFLEIEEENRKHFNLWGQETANPFLSVVGLNIIMLEMTERVLLHPNVQELLLSDETFDVVVTEQFMDDALKGLSAHFHAPLILQSTLGANSWTNTLVGNPSPPSYVPNIFLSYSSSMSVKERTINSVVNVFSELLHQFYVYPNHAKLAKKYLRNINNFDDVLYNASLVLMNSHPSTNQAVPFVPNMIDIGGFHVKPPKKLPQDLQEFLDEAKDGVIYFSMGSNLKSKDLPVEKRDALLKTFRKLKEKVLWKWEEDVLPGQPPNVKLSKWLPQQDILGHPNVKLFITHGGLLSITEATYHGVPVLAIPIFGDQKMNAKNIVNGGFGLSLSYGDLTEEQLTEKLNQLLRNPSYAENVRARSKIFHDRMTSPMDTAIYWVEYVIRHKGAPHLRVAGVDLPLYRYLLLDVMAFGVGVVVLTFYIFSMIGKKVCCLRKGQGKVKTN